MSLPQSCCPLRRRTPGTLAALLLAILPLVMGNLTAVTYRHTASLSGSDNIFNFSLFHIKGVEILMSKVLHMSHSETNLAYRNKN